MNKRNKKEIANINSQESFRIIANNFKKYQDRGIKCVAVTSHCKEQGKSLVVQELAKRLAKSGDRILVVDANVFKPTLTQMLQSQGSLGILNLLDEIHMSKGVVPSLELLEKDYIHQIGDENVYLIGKGGDETDIDYEVVMKQEYLKSLFEALKAAFDYILVEVPSFECLSYTQIITEVVDGCMLVIKSGELDMSCASKVREQLDSLGCEVLGCILNKKEDISYKIPKEKKGLKKKVKKRESSEATLTSTSESVVL